MLLKGRFILTPKTEWRYIIYMLVAVVNFTEEAAGFQNSRKHPTTSDTLGTRQMTSPNKLATAMSALMSPSNRLVGKNVDSDPENATACPL